MQREGKGMKVHVASDRKLISGLEMLFVIRSD